MIVEIPDQFDVKVLEQDVRNAAANLVASIEKARAAREASRNADDELSEAQERVRITQDRLCAGVTGQELLTALREALDRH